MAYPSLISRLISAVAVTVFCFRKQNTVRYKITDILCWDSKILKMVMGIALPNGLENGVHQLVKVALSSMVALFGTYQIAANGVAQSITIKQISISKSLIKLHLYCLFSGMHLSSL